MSHGAFYLPVGDDPAVFAPTPATAGPWSAQTQHAGPPSALLARAAVRHVADREFVLASVAVDILGPLPLEPMTLSARTIRPGRRIRLVEVTALVGGRVALTLRAWFARRAPSIVTEVVSGPDDAPAALPDQGQEPPLLDALMPEAHVEGYLAAVEARFCSGGFAETGPAEVWMRPRIPLVGGEEPTPWERTLIVADSGSGVSLAARPDQLAAINCDLRVALHREPAGPWVHLTSVTRIGSSAGGLASTTLRDERGVIGQASQSLVVSTGDAS